jgi:D-alanyl-lipoteichoic acid acyltransferase DltB (MBOAT superfamily)
MLLDNLCTPTFVFIVFSIAHLSLDMYDQQYTLALLKVVLVILMVCLLEMLCILKLHVVAWVLVFMPLILYSYMTLIIFSVFGLDPSPKMKQFLVQ